MIFLHAEESPEGGSEKHFVGNSSFSRAIGAEGGEMVSPKEYKWVREQANVGWAEAWKGSGVMGEGSL